MTEWTRAVVYGEKYSHRNLADFTGASEAVAWRTENPYSDATTEDVMEAMLRQTKWRYHHGLPELEDTVDFYAAYSRRVEAMLEALDTALSIAEVDVRSSSFIDIGAAEGYVCNHIHGSGARSVDAVELNELNIRRMWMVRAVKGIDPGRIATLDLESVNWAESVGRTYDVTLALGIVYHMENPMLFLRNLFELTDRAAVVESDTPLFPSNHRFRGFGMLYLNRDQVTLGQNNVRYLLEMRPDRQGLVEMLIAAGFARVVEIPAATKSPFNLFSTGEKSVLLALP